MCYSQVHFEDDARGKYLELLGYKKEELALKVILLPPHFIINSSLHIIIRAIFKEQI